MMAPSFTTRAANGPPPRRTFSSAISMTCLKYESCIPSQRTRSWRDQSGPDRIADHTGRLMYSQLFEDAAAVGIGGLVADAQLRGGFLGGFAAGDQHQHLALALGESEHHTHRFIVRRENA